ncbi:MAG TPA: phage terminase large subunit [Pyrinomonadaceae bacterium]|nr:phage terminase large subunit [Pyrinomonadaceae bacterium]
MKQDYYSQNPLLIQAANNAIKRRIEREKGDAVLMAARAGIVPDAWQSDLLRSDAKQMILLCSRQSGKSTTTSILALHQAIYTPNSLILLLSPSLRQSQELFRKLQDFYNALESDSLPTATEESALRMELSNGSRIIALPGKEATIRGFSGVSLLIIDEASRVEDALYQSVRPMLAVSGGRIILLSTPFGKRGFFFSEWTDGIGWRKIKITADQCPRIDRDWLERERQMIGDWWYLQEYFCEFVETNDQVFSYDDIQTALDADIKPLFPKE